MKDIAKETITLSTKLLDALKTMDERKVKTLFVFTGKHFEGLLTIGDIQRAIINNVALQEPVSLIFDREKIYGYTDEEEDTIRDKMRGLRAEVMPILNDKGNLVDVWFWDDVFSKLERTSRKQFSLPVVIMAGGQGTRLRPLTNVLPKPLIPIGEQTMMEDIMDRFMECGCHKFYVSVNYKADFIRHYFDNFGTHRYDIEYFQEDKPLGTAGSLYLLKDKIKETFFVSNCDSIIEADYADILDYHRSNKNEITLVSAMKSIYIPYGTLETGENGLLESIQEKPELTFKVNTGMYILEPYLLKEIPSDRVFHITYLIDKLIKEGRRVGVYPINEGAWIDVGNWDEYLKQFAK